MANIVKTVLSTTTTYAITGMNGTVATVVCTPGVVGPAPTISTAGGVMGEDLLNALAQLFLLLATNTLP